MLKCFPLPVTAPTLLGLVPLLILAAATLAAGSAAGSAPAAGSAQAAEAASPPLKIVIVGDSTVSDYPETQPERGWGQYIAGQFRAGTVQVVNLARSGRSTKTFLKEGRWKTALDEKPNYILIQFGHNDSHAPEKPESTDADTDYRENLRRYVDEARAIGARPVLVTPMVRRAFDGQGKIKPALQPYAEAMKAVGTEKGVPVVDLYSSSLQLAQNLGPEKSAEFANKAGDNTHFNEKGARAMAELVMKELPELEPGLKPYLKPAGR